MKLIVLVLLAVQGALCRHPPEPTKSCPLLERVHLSRECLANLHPKNEHPEEIGEAYSRCSQNVSVAVHEVLEAVAEARNVSSEVNVSRCLDGLVSLADQIQRSFRIVVNSRCISHVHEEIDGEAILGAILKVGKCLREPKASCEHIRKCCRGVAENSSEEDSDSESDGDSAENDAQPKGWVKAYNECVSNECRNVQNEIQNVRSAVKGCLPPNISTLPPPLETTTSLNGDLSTQG